MADTLKELSEKYKKIKKNRQQYNTVDISNFLPTLNEMIKEDCVIDVLEDNAKQLNNKDNSMDAAYYTKTPFAIEPGYYKDQDVFVIKTTPVSTDSTWGLNKADGDTLNFYLNNMDTNGGFDFHNHHYNSFEDYIVKQCVTTSNSIDRSSVSLRFAGINAPEIPHYEAALIYNKSNIQKMKISELKDLKAKGENAQFLDYTINKNGSSNPDKWTTKSRSDNTEVEVYVKEDEDKKNYYEIVNNVDATKYIGLSNLNSHKDYIAKTIVFTNASTKDNVLEGYKAQYKLKNLIENNKVQDWRLVVDGASQTYTKTYPTYTVYQSLYKTPDNIKNLIQAYIDACDGLGTPLAKLNYKPFGTESYGRILGTLYAQIKTDTGTFWIDVSKYITSGNGQVKLADTSNLGNGFSDAVGIGGYHTGNFTYVDSPDKNGIKSYNEKIALHKKITGIDFTKAKEYTVMIGDFLALIPPQSIRNVNNVDYERVPIMRGKGTMTKNQANREQMVEIDLYFYGDAGINGIKYDEKLPNGKNITYRMNGLRALMAQFRLAPFLPIENSYINDVLGIEAVALVNFTLTTVDGFPRLLKATLTLRDFNYRVYMPDLPINYYGDENNLKGLGKSQVEQIFGKCFEWKLFRYYYQRALINGEDLSIYDFNTFDYANEFYSHKNALQPSDLTDNYMEFYIPDENWLKSALQYKKAMDYSGQTVQNINLGTKDKNFLKQIASLKKNIVSDSKYGFNDLDISLRDTDAYIYNNGKDHSNKDDSTINNLPNYNGKLIQVLNNNEPSFTSSQKKDTKSWQKYSNLDSKGRCGTAFANVGKDIMPTGSRGDIDSVTPTGFDDNARYDFINGKKLYNRCHLIGWQLTGQNANNKNLITGTKALNNDGMLPYENLVAGYIKSTGNHVLYRVTPVFNGNNLVASGVHMEGYSVEDKGKGIKFNVFVYNVQDGVDIDYATGKSKANDKTSTSSKDESDNKNISKYYYKDIGNKHTTGVQIRKGGTHNYKNGQEIINRCIKKEIVDKIMTNPVVDSVRVDEAYVGDGKLQWPIVIKLDMSKCKDTDKVREAVKQLTGASSTKKCLEDDSVTFTIASEWNAGDYIPGSVSYSYGDELDAIIGAYNQDDAEANPIGSNKDMFDFTKYKDPRYMKFIPFMYDKNGKSKKLDVDAITFSMSNTFTEMYLKACDGYAPQFMGGSDVTVEAKFTMTEQDVIYNLNKLPAVVTQYTKKYRKVMPCYPLKVKNSYLQTLGLNEMLIDTIQVETIDGIPGAYEIIIRMTSVDRSLRQREAMKKIESNQVTTTISESDIVNMFDLQEQLAKAEVYPDLDLPTINELSKCGWQYLKYSNEKRLFVDPDFYIVYSFKYSAQLTKEILNKYVYQRFLKDDKIEDLKGSTFNFEDAMGIKMKSRFDEVLGSSWENTNKYADIYDDIIQDVSEQAKNEGKTTNTKKSKARKELDSAASIGATLEYLSATGVIDSGWNLNGKFNATLADETTNKGVEKLKCSGLNQSGVDDDESTNEIYQEIYDMRAKAIHLIDKILAKEMNYTKDDMEKQDIVIACKQAVVNIFVKDKDGKELFKLLNGDEEPKDLSWFGGIFDSEWEKYFPSAGADYEFGFGGGQKYFKETLKASNAEPNLMQYLFDYLYATACAYSYKKPSSVDNEIAGARQYKANGDPYVSLKDTDYTKEQISLTSDEINGDWNKFMNQIYKAEGGGTFGMNHISTITTEQTMRKLKPNVVIKYKYNNKNVTKMYPKETDVFCQDNAFIDPYYNKAGHRSEKGKKYKEYITKYPTSNAEAQLRIVLLYLKKMIIEGYYFSEFDSVHGDYNTIKEEINKTLQKNASEVLSTGKENMDQEKLKNYEKRQQTMNSMTASVQEYNAERKTGLDVIGGEQGANMDEVNELLEDLPEVYKSVYCARMIYPFIAAIVGYDHAIFQYIKNRDYETLGTLSTGLSSSMNNKDLFNRFLSALTSLGVIDEGEPNGTKDDTTVAQKVNNLLMQEAFTACSDDPRQYVLHSFYDMIVNDKRGRLLRAFPTYYLVFIDEGRKIGSWKLFDNFYNMSAISEIQVTKSRKIPTDTCTFTMSNLYMSYADTYDNSVYQQYVDIYGIKDVYDSLFSPRSYLEKEDMVRRRKQLRDTTVISPGVRIHARLGYGSDASKLPIVFNGKIAEVDCGEVVNVVCQGDGGELCNPLNTLGEITAKNFQTGQHYITWFKDIRGSFMRGGESPRNLAVKLINAEYNGTKKIFRDMTQNRFFADNPFGIYHFGNRRFQDIFVDGETVQNLYEVSNETLLSGYNTLINDKTQTACTPTINCTLQDKTYWEILNLCANSGDGYYAAIRDFGFRSTVCLCKANHYYAYEYRKQGNTIYEKRKPFQQFHYFDSYNDIVYNTIKATEKNMKTNAVGTWQSTDYIWGTSQDTVGPIFLDANIYPEYQKSMTVDTGIIGGGNGGLNLGLTTHLAEQWESSADSDKVNKSLVEKVTTNVLRNSIKDMYEGELCVIGDSSIKPFDTMCFNDTYEDMSGTVEVETVIHTFNSTTGYTTTIIPDIITCTESIEQRAGASNITGKFTMAAGAGVARVASSHMIANLPSYLTDVGGVAGSSLLKVAKEKIGTIIAECLGAAGKTVVASETGLVLTEVGTAAGAAGSTATVEAGTAVAGGLLSNPVGIGITAVAVASTFIFGQNIKDLLYRTLKNIQAITVFPIQKNGRPLIANMAGHKGSVYGYPYPNESEKDSIQWMIMHFYEDVPLVQGLVKTIASDYDYEGIFNNWKKTLHVGDDNELMSSSYSQTKNQAIFMKEVYDSLAVEFSSRASYIQSLKTKPRISKFNTSNKTSEEYLKYQIGGIWKDKDADKYKNIPKEEKSYVSLRKLATNKRFGALSLIEEDEEIKLAMNKEHSNIKKFTFSHSSNQAKELDVYRENGNRRVHYLISDIDSTHRVYDFPMIHEDALAILKLIINDSALKDCEVNFDSGVRVNDTRSWKSTGFAFSITSEDSYDALVKAVENVKKDTMWYNSNTKRYTFDFAKNSKGNLIAITVYAPSKE